MRTPKRTMGIFFFWWAMKSMSYVCNFLSLEKSGQSVMSVWSVNTGSSVGMNYWCRLQKLPDFKQEAINLVVCAVFNLLKNLITMPEKKRNAKMNCDAFKTSSLWVSTTEFTCFSWKLGVNMQKKRKEKVLLVGISSKTCVSCCGNRDLETFENWQVLSRDCLWE